jgi:hypothetical protein
MKRQVVILGAGFGGLELSTSRHRLEPIVGGGGQEPGLRAGPKNVALASACIRTVLRGQSPRSGPRGPQKFDRRLPLNVNPPHQRSRVEHGRAAPAEARKGHSLCAGDHLFDHLRRTNDRRALNEVVSQ